MSEVAVYWVDGDVYSDTTPYSPIRDFVRRQLGLGADADRATVADAFAALVHASAPTWSRGFRSSDSPSTPTCP